MEPSPMSPVVGPPVDVVLTLTQKEVVISIRVAMAIFSLVGSLFVLSCMLWYKKYFGPHRLIMFLTLCNLGEAISNLLSFGTFNHEATRVGLCYFQGLSMQFFQVASFCWTAAIAVNLWLVVVKKRLDVDVYQVRYHLVVWSIAATCTIIPNFTKAYGPANAWCWISKEAKAGNAFRFATFFIPFYISWIVIVVAYIWISRVVLTTFMHMRNSDRDHAERQIKRLRAYPIIFIILYIPATINRLYNWTSQDESYLLFILQALTAPAVGFVNSIAYGLDVEIKNRLANIFVRRGMCSYCFGDVMLPEEFGVTSGVRSKSGPEETEDEEIIEGVLDDHGGVKRAPGQDEPVYLDEDPLSFKYPGPRTEDDDTVRVDF